MAWLAHLGRGAGILASRGLDLLYPPRCLFCRAEWGLELSDRLPACPDCSRKLTGIEPRCPGCGEPGSSATACPRCRARRDRGGIAVLTGYGDEARAAVLAAKRPGGELQAAGLAALLLARHRDTFAAWGVDLVVPVPMHWLRRLLRGTNAAELLARGLASGLGLPCRGLLRRTRATRMQNELPPEARPANVRGAFRAAAVPGRRVLLVDDVTTTGATLAACRQALLAAGAAEVHAAVVARADRTGSRDREATAP